MTISVRDPVVHAGPAPVAVEHASERLTGVDVLRGAVMVLMALDHVRVYFSAEPLGPLTQVSASLFVTRWVTHFCAPVFVFLAGAGAFLHGRRLERAALARYLATRGAWLILLEMTVIRLSWTFNLGWNQFLLAGVIWVIGLSMLCMAGLVFLPRAALLAFGLVLVCGHDLVGSYVGGGQGGPGQVPFQWLFQVLYFGGRIPLGENGPTLAILYVLVPWVGVMALGYAFGAVLARERERRRSLCFVIGASAIGLFLVLRGFNLYGDPSPWAPSERGALFTLFSFVNTNKYPASLLFLLMTLGPAIALLPWLETLGGRLARILAVFGRAPLFYYLLHIPLIHVLALTLALAHGGSLDPWLTSNFPMTGPPPAGLGHGVPGLVALTALTAALLYLPCRWFARVKRERAGGWTSYL